jgi:S1-C subfamily serine protease/ankyrin repeat protein
VHKWERLPCFVLTNTRVRLGSAIFSERRVCPGFDGHRPYRTMNAYLLPTKGYNRSNGRRDKHARRALAFSRVWNGDGPMNSNPHSYAQANQNQITRLLWRSTITLAVILSCTGAKTHPSFGAVTGHGIAKAFATSRSATAKERLTAHFRNSIDHRPVLSVEQIGRLATPSVVTVTAKDANGNPMAIGSGILLTPAQGNYKLRISGRVAPLVVTNLHVISGAHAITIRFDDGRSVQVFLVYNQDSTCDLALLAADTRNCKPLSLANSEDIQIGEPVVAIGSPLGFSGTVSTGIVSAIRKYGAHTLIQTTAPISHGSSGGALLNRYGEVIGVTSLSLNGIADNLNFAYAVGHVRNLIASKPTPITVEKWVEARNAAFIRLWDHECIRPNDFPAADQLRRALGAGADVNAKAADKTTALMHMACGSPDCVRLLLDYGADVNEADAGGYTALMNSTGLGEIDCARLLLDAGAAANAKDYRGETALLLLSQSQFKDASLAKLLIEHGADVNAKADDGDTPIMESVLDSFRPDYVKVLLDSGADPNSRNSDEVPVLQLAIIFDMGTTDNIKLLLDHGADVNGTDNGGGTALMQACFNGYLDAVKLLLANGADVNARDKGGATALGQAKNDVIARTLTQAGATE